MKMSQESLETFECRYLPLNHPTMREAMVKVLAWLSEQKECFQLGAIKKACELTGTIAEHSLFALILEKRVKSFTRMRTTADGQKVLFFGMPDAIEKFKEARLTTKRRKQ